VRREVTLTTAQAAILTEVAAAVQHAEARYRLVLDVILAGADVAACQVVGYDPASCVLTIDEGAVAAGGLES
jgi:hypothetical protein